MPDYKAIGKTALKIGLPAAAVGGAAGASGYMAAKARGEEQLKDLATSASGVVQGQQKLINNLATQNYLLRSAYNKKIKQSTT